jgi:hypothetical protein
MSWTPVTPDTQTWSGVLPAWDRGIWRDDRTWDDSKIWDDDGFWDRTAADGATWTPA